MVTLTELNIPGYEKVVRVTDEASGLHGFIAVHDSTVGHAKDGLNIALGGLRMLPYENELAALKDVLKLSKGMTYKSAIAEDWSGGAKSVIIGDPRKLNTLQRERLMEAMGEAIAKFGQSYPSIAYVAAEDMNTKPYDMKAIRRKTNLVAGLPYDEFDGQPSPFTALGVLTAMKRALGVQTMKDKKVAIAGVGGVGGALAESLIAEEAELFIADINQKAIDKVMQLGGKVTVVSPDEIHKQEVDVYAPCARGDCLNKRTIPEIKAPLICGAANNQLEDDTPEGDGKRLHDAGKVYVPDFVANSGGVISIAMEVKHRNEGIPLTIKEIKDRVVSTVKKATSRILEIAKDDGIPHSEAAIEVAREKLEEASTSVHRPGPWAVRHRRPRASGELVQV